MEQNASIAEGRQKSMCPISKHNQGQFRKHVALEAVLAKHLPCCNIKLVARIDLIFREYRSNDHTRIWKESLAKYLQRFSRMFALKNEWMDLHLSRRRGRHGHGFKEPAVPSHMRAIASRNPNISGSCHIMLRIFTVLFFVDSAFSSVSCQRESHCT